MDMSLATPAAALDWPAQSSPRLVRAARLARFAGTFTAAFLLLILPQLLWLLRARAGPSPFASLFLRFVTWGMGLRVEVRGHAFTRGALIVANHISWTDILVLGARTPTAFVSREDVRRWPLFGLLARLNGTVFVDRSARGSLTGQIDAIRTACDRGRVTLFPEGTTGNGVGTLPFRSALFGAADDRAVQPVSIVYLPKQDRAWRRGELSWFAWDGDKPFLLHFLAVIASGGARCVLRVHAPLPAGRGDRKSRAAEARSIIESGLNL